MFKRILKDIQENATPEEKMSIAFSTVSLMTSLMVLLIKIMA